MRLDEPNLRMPFATSYNERGIAAFTNVDTRGIDQQKLNSMYEPAINGAAGKSTLYLVKRPGVTVDASSIGVSTQVAYLISPKAGATTLPVESMWVFAVSTNDVCVSDTTTTKTIVTAAGYIPTYLDKTNISGVDTLVLQTRNSSFAQRIFYSQNISSWTEITSSVLAGLTLNGKMEFVDGYGLILTSLNRIYNTNVNDLNTVLASSYATKQIQQDIPRSLMRFGTEVLACGAETIETFVNSGQGGVGSPLKSVDGKYHRVGLEQVDYVGAGPFYATIGNKLYFIAQTPGVNSKGLFMYDGATIQRISPPHIEKMLFEQIQYSLYAIGLGGQQAIALELDAPTVLNVRNMLVYFPRWNEWFHWKSTVFQARNSGQFHLGLQGGPNRVYRFTASDNWQDAGTDYTWTHQFKVPRKDNARKAMVMCGVSGDTTSTALLIDVLKSDDDYQTWTTTGQLDMTKQNKAIYRCGAYRDRAIRLTYTGAQPVRLEQFLARIE